MKYASAVLAAAVLAAAAIGSTAATSPIVKAQQEMRVSNAFRLKPTLAHIG